MSSDRSSAPQEASRPAWRRATLRIGISAAILVVLFVFIPFAEVRSAMQRVTPAMWAMALVCYLGLHLIGVTKWRLLVNTAGARLSRAQAVHAYYAGLFGNIFLPSIVGGDVVRAGVAFRVTHARIGVILGSLVDRVLDLIGLATVAGIGALLAPRALDPQSRSIFISVAAVIALAAAVAAVLVMTISPRRYGYGLRRKMARIRIALRAVRRRPSAVFSAFILGIMLQTLLIVLNAWLGARAGIDVPLYVWLFVWPLAKMSGIAPTQNGIGVREAAQVALFAPFGVAAGLAMAAGLLFEVIIIVGGLLAGGIAFAIGRLAVPSPTQASTIIASRWRS